MQYLTVLREQQGVFAALRTLFCFFACLFFASGCFGQNAQELTVMPAIGDGDGRFVKVEKTRLPAPDPINAEAIAELVPFVSEEPLGLGAPVSDRAFWDPLARLPGADEVIASAESVVDASIPQLTEEKWLRYQTENDRYAYQTPYTQLTYHLTDLALAEALEDTGRFLPQIENYLEAFLDLPTWST
ncbi:MAG: hypothetical protein ACQKBW_02955, partial [Puniceicoccales bacterium]